MKARKFAGYSGTGGDTLPELLQKVFVGAVGATAMTMRTRRSTGMVTSIVMDIGTVTAIMTGIATGRAMTATTGGATTMTAKGTGTETGSL